MNNKINKLQERALRIVYKDTQSTFEELLRKAENRASPPASNSEPASRNPVKADRAEVDAASKAMAAPASIMSPGKRPLQPFPGLWSRFTCGVDSPLRSLLGGSKVRRRITKNPVRPARASVAAELISTVSKET